MWPCSGLGSTGLFILGSQHLGQGSQVSVYRGAHSQLPSASPARPQAVPGVSSEPVS